MLCVLGRRSAFYLGSMKSVGSWRFQCGVSMAVPAAAAPVERFRVYYSVTGGFFGIIQRKRIFCRYISDVESPTERRIR